MRRYIFAAGLLTLFPIATSAEPYMSEKNLKAYTAHMSGCISMATFILAIDPDSVEAKAVDDKYTVDLISTALVEVVGSAQAVGQLSPEKREEAVNFVINMVNRTRQLAYLQGRSEMESDADSASRRASEFKNEMLDTCELPES